MASLAIAYATGVLDHAMQPAQDIEDHLLFHGHRVTNQPGLYKTSSLKLRPVTEVDSP